MDVLYMEKIYILRLAGVCLGRVTYGCNIRGVRFRI